MLLPDLAVNRKFQLSHKCPNTLRNGISIMKEIRMINTTVAAYVKLVFDTEDHRWVWEVRDRGVWISGHNRDRAQAKKRIKSALRTLSA
jgi:hypothetical protein